ncbi:MAG: hypothetical protein CVV41_19425 [Candidatus Riflebacteria bacterium HGW-Riflebacteria-1]|nr:MAG: hypothetical protein CVV41_19425 [Candidatus Riflebacteria bacterium HGW-Riflebacteria-1]
MKALVRFSVLFMLVSVLAFTGCFLTDDDDDDYVAPTGEIELSADINIAGTGITPAIRAAIAEDLRAAPSSKFKALIKLAGRKLVDSPLEVKSATELTMDKTTVTVATGKQQVTIEVVPVEDETKPVLKTVVVAEVVSGTPVEKKDTAVNTTTTAQAVAYEAWVEKDATKTIEDFVATVDSAKITALETQIKTTLSSGGDLTATAITSEAKEVAAATPVPTEPTPVPLTTEETVKAAYNLWLRALASATQRLTPDAAAAAKIDDMLDADFIWEGFNKTTWADKMKRPPADFFDSRINSFSGDSTLTKVDESTYVVRFNGTISGLDKAGTSYSTAIDGTKNAFALTGAANQTAFSITGTVNHAWAAVIVKKGTDGTWRINGNRVKASPYLELVIAQKWLGASGHPGINVNLWKGSQSIVSAIVSGGILNATGTVNLSENPNNSDEWGWAAGANYSWIPAPSGTSIAAGQVYVITATFADGSQTYNYTVPALPTSYAAPTVTLTSPAAGQLSATWTAEPSTSFSEYWVGINYVDGPGGNMGDEVYSASILNASQNQLQRTGLTEGRWVRVEVNVKTKTGFCYRTNSELQIAASTRFSGNYRVFELNASTQNRWVGMSEVTVSGNQLSATVKLDPDSTEINKTNSATFTESNGAIAFSGSTTNRGAISPSGNIGLYHDYKAGDPVVGLFVKRPTSASVATLNGTYRFYEFQDSVNSSYVPTGTSLMLVSEITFNGSGNFSNFHTIYKDGNWTPTATGNYSVSADGQVSIGDGSNQFVQVSADGNVIVFVQYLANDICAFAVAIKQDPSLTTADMNGNWLYACVSAGPGTPYSFTDGQLVTFNNGSSSWTGGVSDVSSEIPADRTQTVALGANGLLDIDSNTYGALAGNKELLATVSKDGTMRYLSLIVKK